MKKNIFTYIALSSLVLVGGGLISVKTFAAVDPTMAALRLQRQEQRTDLRRTGADMEITRRIDALNHLITVINDMKKISADSKNQLISQIQTEINSLTTLKAKIDADTDPATLLADKKSIVSAYRVFLLYMPKMRIIVHADKILYITDLLKSKNPSADAMAKINDAVTNANNAINAVLGLDPSGWPANKTTLESARSMLKTARTDINSAWTLIKTAGK